MKTSFKQMKIHTFIFGGLFMLHSAICAQENLSYTKDVYVTAGDSLPYRLLYPRDYDSKKKYPMVVFLHGSGQRGNDNQSQLIGVPKKLTDSLGRIKYPCFILVPQCAKKDVWVKFPNFPNSLKATDAATPSAGLVLAKLDELLKELPIDRRRIYLTGYSMGGEGTFDLMARRPKLFAAGVPICSVADTATANMIRNIPIWAFHGDQDEVNDVKYTRMMVDALQKQKGKVKYTEYPGVKHNSWTKSYAEPELFDWLFAQKK